MIDLYTWGTPNGFKVSIMLEELGLAYTVHPINILDEDQFAPDYIAINPNAKIPAIVDVENGLTISESGAILIYLAEKYESDLLPTSGPERYDVLQWLMLQMGGVGPIFGQVHHFYKFSKEDIPYAKQRFGDEMTRLYGVLDAKLAKTTYIAGNSYSIADIALYPWVARHEWHPLDLNEFCHVKRWYDTLSSRTGIKRGMDVPK
ncbi:MAG: glutathione S-transferase N-terminal domain-containing protein [Magnetovibrio sp.]|nr:glutathione S-transferase N-terminal domain-containing protein [Magnetovibrio sp.]